MIFSTVHRSKGMEYDAIHIVNDFITEEGLEKTINCPNNVITIAPKYDKNIFTGSQIMEKIMNIKEIKQISEKVK